MRSTAGRVLTVALALALLVPAGAFAQAEETPPDLTTPVTTPVPPATPAPVVIVRSYTASAARLLIGQPFDLTLDVYNATSRPAANVVVSLGSAASGATAGLTVLDTGSAKYVGQLNGKRSASVTFRVIGNPGSTPGAISLPVTVSFEHENERKEVTYNIGLLLERQASLSLAGATLPESAVVGETFDASFEVANGSSFALSGVSLSVEASGAVVADGTLFLGAMDAATTEAIDVTITPEQAGELQVAFVVTYLDDFGRTQTFRETRTVTVQESPTPEEVPGGEVPEEAPKENWFIAFIKALLGIGG